MADGSSPFKPQTVLLSVSRAVGIDETRRRRAEHGSRASIKKGRSQRGQARGVSRFFGLSPLLGGDDANKASCGVIRSGSGEPWFDRKNEAGEMYGIHGGELTEEKVVSPLLIALLNRRLTTTALASSGES